MMPRILLSVLFGTPFLFASTAVAQEGARHEVSAQGTGFFTKDSDGNGISQHSTDTGGFLVSYRFHINRWLAADGSYGYSRETQQNFTSAGAFNIQSNAHQATGALVVALPWGLAGLKPYALAGAGALVFDPTGTPGGFVAGADRETKPAFLCGGGAEFKITNHLSVRAEYRGFVYKRPDFGLSPLSFDATTHTAQPSAGIVFRL